MGFQWFLHLKRMVVWKDSGGVVVLILPVPHCSVSCWIILPSALFMVRKHRMV